MWPQNRGRHSLHRIDGQNEHTPCEIEGLTFTNGDVIIKRVAYLRILLLLSTSTALSLLKSALNVNELNQHDFWKRKLSLCNLFEFSEKANQIKA